MAFCDRATVDAAESQCRDGSIGEAALGQGLERCFTPAVAAQAVKLQRVVASEQVGNGVQVDRGGHRDPSVRSMRAQGVSLVRRGDTRASDAAPQGW